MLTINSDISITKLGKKLSSYIYTPVKTPAVLDDEILGRPPDQQHQVILINRYRVGQIAGAILLSIQKINIIINFTIHHKGSIPHCQWAVLEENLF